MGAKCPNISLEGDKMLKNGFKAVWLYQLLCLASMFALSPLLSLLGIADSQNIVMLSELVMIVPCAIGLLVLKNNCGRIDPAEDLGICRIQPEYLLYVILMPVFYQIFCVYMTMPLTLGLNILFGSDVPDIQAPDSISGYICTILGLCVFAPVLEELICRGIMVRFMKGFSFQAVMLTTSLAFSMLHMDMSGFVQIFFLGMFLFLLRTATGSIFSSMLAHSIINLISFLTIITSDSNAPEKFQTILFTVELGSLIVMPMLLVNFLRITSANSHWTHKCSLKGKKTGVSAAFIIFTVIYIVFNLSILADNISSGYTKRAAEKIFRNEIISGEEST